MSAASVAFDREGLRKPRRSGCRVQRDNRPSHSACTRSQRTRPESELARHVEREVFYEYFNNTPELLEAEYGPYEASTLFVCMMDHRRRLPAGVIRLVLPSPAGLKSLGDVEPVWGHRIDDVLWGMSLRLEADSAWDVATLAVDSEYRGRATDGLVSLGLYQSVAQLAAPRCHVG